MSKLIQPKDMRLLVFCGSRKAIEKFDMAGWLVLVGAYTSEHRQQILAEFAADPNCRLAADRSAIFGWRAPDNTVVLFDPSWKYSPDSPETYQAVARVRSEFAVI
jgi:hypothetical protein